MKGAVTLADVAPTQAELLHFDGFTAPDGTAMTSAIQPGQSPPKLVVVLVWDSAGINVLDTHRGQWPYLRSLIPKGTWYTDASVGLVADLDRAGSRDDRHRGVPHPSRHRRAPLPTGRPGHHAVAHRPELLRAADVRRHLRPGREQNKPIAGMVATADIHLGMLGHG